MPRNFAVDQSLTFPPLVLARAQLLGFYPERDCEVHPYWVRRNNELIEYAIEVIVHTATRFKPLECLHVGYGCFLNGYWIVKPRRFWIIEAFCVCRRELNIEDFVLTNLALEPVNARLEDSHGKSRWRV